ncbi:hypothetical protein HPP92_010566 [Vanilla planifolia]|uniref:Uncharacterized protein n=1 Tax=Vanilla planifolia TaxID=51239 RepID=A0A835V1Y5_VANPL|nr:hypothetical protein HPP92_010566 [Vanilla planifolia]
MAKTWQRGTTVARGNARVKSECKIEVGEDDHRTQANSKFEVGGADAWRLRLRNQAPLSKDASCARHRLKVGGRVKLPKKHGPATLHLNRRRLSALLDRLVAAHC